MKLTDEEKNALREAAQAPVEEFAPRIPAKPLPSAEYLRQLEQWMKVLPRPQKPVAFDGPAWRL